VRNLGFASVLLTAVMAVGTSRAADVPPPDILGSIVAKLSPQHHTEIEFVKDALPPSSLCRLQPYDMRFVSSERLVRSYSVMLDPQSGGAVSPHEFFAVLSRITVDTDGSPHTYHPEDPDGTGTCQRVRNSNGQETLQGICAIEKFANGDAHVFRDDVDLAGGEMVAEWRDLWPLIRERRLKPVDLDTGDGQKNRYLFYWDARRLTAVFNDDVIPRDRRGFPCMQEQGSAYAGYFVAATTQKQIAPTREDGCAPQRYLDAETVPYFVLPKGGFGDVRVGDVAIAQIVQNGTTRTVYGLVGDAGGGRLGEASVAFNAALLGKLTGSLSSMRDTWALDIDGARVAVLVLGGTREKFNGLYTPANIGVVARSELARWGGNEPLRRFEACAAASPVNPKR
jgi:hypothetical protein